MDEIKRRVAESERQTAQRPVQDPDGKTCPRPMDNGTIRQRGFFLSPLRKQRSAEDVKRAWTDIG